MGCFLLYNNFVMEGISNNLDNNMGAKDNQGMVGTNEQNVAELISFGEKNGNKLNFKDFGADFDFIKDEDRLSIRVKKEALEDLDEKGQDLMKYFLAVFKSYVSGPIFTDEFHQDHTSRRKWEKTLEKSCSEGAKRFYNKNRLGINQCASVMGCLDLIQERVLNQNIKDELLRLRVEVPKELKEKQEDGLLKYYFLSDEEKIDVIKRLSNIAERAIAILEESSPEQ